MRQAEAGPDRNRRWAGTFRECTSCGGRNWVGAQRCRTCDGLLVGTRAVARPPVAMIGRRTADRVMTRRVKAALAGGVVIALGGGLLLLHLLRTDAFQTSPVLADTTPAPSPMAAEAGVASSLAAEPATPAPLAEGLRMAERGRKLLERGNTRGAVEALSEAARVLPDDAEVAHLFGAALWRFGAQDRAIFQLRRALLIARDNPVFREDLARALQNTGHNAEAVHVLREGEAMGVPPLPPDTPAVMGLSPEPAGDGVNMGGAGNGRYAGRTSFTDADLHTRPAPVTTPAAAAPSPEPQQ